jgi:hypothetical protein
MVVKICVVVLMICIIGLLSILLSQILYRKRTIIYDDLVVIINDFLKNENLKTKIFYDEYKIQYNKLFNLYYRIEDLLVIKNFVKYTNNLLKNDSHMGDFAYIEKLINQKYSYIFSNKKDKEFLLNHLNEWYNLTQEWWVNMYLLIEEDYIRYNKFINEQDLKPYLDEAISIENFELAAEIRDFKII